MPDTVIAIDKVSEADAQTLDEWVLVSLVFGDIWRWVAKSINEAFYITVSAIDIMFAHH